MKHSLFLGLIAFFLLTACKDDADSEMDGANKSEATKIQENKEFEEIEVLFTDKAFKDKDELAVLEELRICSNDSELLKTSEVAPCSPENFKLFPLRKDLSLKNGFLVLIKAETAGFPLRRLLIFKRERGELVKLNGFVANLIGRVPTSSGYDDLLLRFQDKDDVSKMWYNCLFTWDDGQYVYKQVETIEGPNWGGPVKDKFKVETSKDIYQTIMDNKMIF